MNIFSRKAPDPIPHLSGYLREMPWLWVARSSWSISNEIKVSEIRSHKVFDEDGAVSGRFKDGSSRYFFHIVENHTESVETVVIEPSMKNSLFFAMCCLLDRKIDLKEIQRAAFFRHGENYFLDVYRPRRGSLFCEGFPYHRVPSPVPTMP